MSIVKNFAELFYSQACLRPKHIAFVVNDQSYTYEECTQKIMQMAAWLKQRNVKRLGILGARSLESYLAILAAHWIGTAYVPLSPKFPAARLNKIIQRSLLDGMIIDKTGLSIVIEGELTAYTQKTILFPLNDIVHAFIVGQQALNLLSPLTRPLPYNPNDMAYLLFTSGSTGEPKGIPISFNNLGYLIAAVRDRYPMDFNDHVAQYSTLSFDASVLDLCFAWYFGATLYSVPEDRLLAPAKFIQHNEISVWFSVPSIIHFMEKLKLLRPNVFPSLKYSFFSGEALTIAQAEAWQKAAPNSIVENLYGLTETTVECLGQVWKEDIKAHCLRDIVPIGRPFANTYAAIMDEEGLFLPKNEKGELVLAGPQLTSGYWQDIALTKHKFISITHPEWGLQRWYKTGDFCFQDVEGHFHYIGRLDNQHKILGNRIELEEIEYYLRQIVQCDEVGAVILKNKNALGESIIAVIGKIEVNVNAVRDHLQKRLPSYMLPTQIICTDHLPCNTNGKLDRKRLLEWLQREGGLE